MSVVQGLARIGSGVRRNGTYEIQASLRRVWTIEMQHCPFCHLLMHKYHEITEDAQPWMCCSHCGFNYNARWDDREGHALTGLEEERLAYLETLKPQYTHG